MFQPIDLACKLPIQVSAEVQALGFMPKGAVIMKYVCIISTFVAMAILGFASINKMVATQQTLNLACMHAVSIAMIADSDPAYMNTYCTALAPSSTCAIAAKPILKTLRTQEGGNS